jgi:hypothetical protein
MRSLILFITVLILLCSIIGSYAVDPQQMLERQRRIVSPSVATSQNQQPPSQNNREVSQYPKSSQDSFSVSSQLPQPQTVNINRLQAPTDSFQPEAPSDYQAQPFQTVTLEQPEKQAAGVTDNAQPAEPVEVEQVVSPEQSAESTENQESPPEEITSEVTPASAINPAETTIPATGSTSGTITQELSAAEKLSVHSK